MRSKLLCMLGIGLAGLIGCNYPDKKPIETEINGYKIKISYSGEGTRMVIMGTKPPILAPAIPSISALDQNNDGRFDEISLCEIPKGHALEQKVNLAELERIYQEALRKEGEGK